MATDLPPTEFRTGTCNRCRRPSQTFTTDPTAEKKSSFPCPHCPGTCHIAEPDADWEIPADISRNTPCPCGSGKKYKFCHGA